MRTPRLNDIFKNPPANVESAGDVSLFCGGPFYRAQVRIHLIEPGRWNPVRRLASVLAIAWLPLVIITGLFSRNELPGLLTDYRVYSTIAIAVPALLIGQILMEDRFCVIVRHVRQANLLGKEDLRELEGVLAMSNRLRDSSLPELVIAAMILAEATLIWQYKLASSPGWAVYRVGEVAHLTLAGWHYWLISVPIYQFLTLLNLWKWLVWGFLLFRLSRMNLKLVATHPDTHGGLGFLGLSPGGFAPIAFALSLAIGANWRNEILNDGARLADFWLPAAILAVVIFLIALAPLAAFVPKLVTLRRKGILEYGTLAQTYVTAYHEKWISHRSGQAEAEAPITKLEANTLTDLTFSYDHIRRMRPFPIDRNTLVGLALSVAVPLFPVVLAEIPASVILRGLIDTVKAVPL